MRKRYTKPVMVSEQFVADEFVSSCLGVACDTTAAKEIELSLKGWSGLLTTHEKDHCGLKTNQWMRADDEGVITGMYEMNAEFTSEPLKCYLYTDATYETEASYKDIQAGDTIYWISIGGVTGQIEFHHVGVVTEDYPGHPLRS